MIISDLEHLEVSLENIQGGGNDKMLQTSSLASVSLDALAMGKDFAATIVKSGVIATSDSSGQIAGVSSEIIASAGTYKI